MATNRIITIAIITVLVLLIIAVIFSKFRWAIVLCQELIGVWQNHCTRYACRNFGLVLMFYTTTEQSGGSTLRTLTMLLLLLIWMVTENRLAHYTGEWNRKVIIFFTMLKQYQTLSPDLPPWLAGRDVTMKTKTDCYDYRPSLCRGTMLSNAMPKTTRIAREKEHNARPLSLSITLPRGQKI